MTSLAHFTSRKQNWLKIRILCTESKRGGMFLQYTTGHHIMQLHRHESVNIEYNKIKLAITSQFRSEVCELRKG
jgi:hypothetical protein